MGFTPIPHKQVATDFILSERTVLVFMKTINVHELSCVCTLTFFEVQDNRHFSFCGYFYRCAEEAEPTKSIRAEFLKIKVSALNLDERFTGVRDQNRMEVLIIAIKKEKKKVAIIKRQHTCVICDEVSCLLSLSNSFTHTHTHNWVALSTQGCSQELYDCDPAKRCLVQTDSCTWKQSLCSGWQRCEDAGRFTLKT